MKKLSLIILLFIFNLIFFSFKTYAVSSIYKVIDYQGEANFSAFLSENNEIFVVGSNSNGQLGRGFKDSNIKMNPTNEPIIGNIRSFTTGKNNFIVAITNDNLIYGWGSNQYGQLAQGTTMNIKNNDLLVPTLININENVEFIDVVAGARHTMILDDEGSVWTFGDNSFGQLGIKEEVSNRDIVFGNPTKIDDNFFDNQKVIQIATSEYTSYALVENGDVYSWGTDYNGQLVIGNESGIELLGTTEKMINFPVKTLFNNVVKIDANSENVGVMTLDNRIYLAGTNSLKQLGVADFDELFSNQPIEVTKFYLKDGTAVDDTPIDFMIGGVTNFILLNNGDIFSFGSGGSNELGYSISSITSEFKDLSTVIAPTKIEFFEPVDLEQINDISNSIYKNQAPVDYSKPVEVKIVRLISSSGNRSLVLDDLGQTWSFGNNSDGLISSGNLATTNTPVLTTLFRLEFYDEAFIRKNYLIKPLLGVALIIVLFGTLFVYLELNLRKQKERDKKFNELIKLNKLQNSKKKEK